MDERDAPAGPISCLPIDQLHPASEEGAHLQLDVVDFERDVVQSFAAPLEKGPDGAGRVGRLYELDVCAVPVEANEPEAPVRKVYLGGDGKAERIPVKRERLVQAAHRHAYPADSLNHPSSRCPAAR